MPIRLETTNYSICKLILAGSLALCLLLANGVQAREYLSSDSSDINAVTEMSGGSSSSGGDPGDGIIGDPGDGDDKAAKPTGPQAFMVWQTSLSIQTIEFGIQTQIQFFGVNWSSTTQ